MIEYLTRIHKALCFLTKKRKVLFPSPYLLRSRKKTGKCFTPPSIRKGKSERPESTLNTCLPQNGTNGNEIYIANLEETSSHLPFLSLYICLLRICHLYNLEVFLFDLFTSLKPHHFLLRYCLSPRSNHYF